jgi:hypothetical protein
MKILYSLPFFFIGCIFLLVSTIFYPAINRLLLDFQGQMRWTTPPFWNLSWVLGIVRIIFIIVGIILTAFAIIMLWLKRH